MNSQIGDIMKKYIFFVLFVLLISTPVFCEPPKTIKYLMNDSVSMLDWGVYRCEQRLLRQVSGFENSFQYIFEVKDVFIDNFIEFDWESGLILFNIRIPLESYQIDKMKDFSEYMISSLKISQSQYINAFNHIGFNRKGNGNNEEILNFLKIKISFLYTNPKEENLSKKYKTFNSECMFNSKKILFSEKNSL